MDNADKGEEVPVRFKEGRISSVTSSVTAIVVIEGKKRYTNTVLIQLDKYRIPMFAVRCGQVTLSLYSGHISSYP